MKIKVDPLWRNKKETGYTYLNKKIGEIDGITLSKGLQLPKKDYKIRNQKITTNDIEKAQKLNKIMRKYLR